MLQFCSMKGFSYAEVLEPCNSCSYAELLDQCAKAVYVLHVVLYVHAYLVYMPLDLISRWSSMQKAQKLVCRLHRFFLKRMPQSNCAVVPDGIDRSAETRLS